MNYNMNKKIDVLLEEFFWNSKKDCPEARAVLSKVSKDILSKKLAKDPEFIKAASNNYGGNKKRFFNKFK